MSSSGSSPKLNSTIRFLMAEVPSFEIAGNDCLEMIAKTRQGPQHRFQIVDSRLSRTVATIPCVSDLVDVPPNGSHLGNTRLQRFQLLRQQWRKRSKVRPDQEGYV